jgi:6,7-dimethyl-8-ribityllumazine synthase
MSKAALRRPAAQKKKRRINIVASRFNERYVQGLIDHTLKELEALVPGAAVSLHRVPGAFEIPTAVRELASNNDTDAIIALGVILQGRTGHATHLARSVTDALQQLALQYRVPVIHAVLSLENENQARERCLEDKINRGTEAARAAVEMIQVVSDLRSRKQ